MCVDHEEPDVGRSASERILSREYSELRVIEGVVLAASARLLLLPFLLDRCFSLGSYVSYHLEGQDSLSLPQSSQVV